MLGSDGVSWSSEHPAIQLLPCDPRDRRCSNAETVSSNINMTLLMCVPFYLLPRTATQHFLAFGAESESSFERFRWLPH